MISRGPFQPLPFLSVILPCCWKALKYLQVCLSPLCVHWTGVALRTTNLHQTTWMDSGVQLRCTSITLETPLRCHTPLWNNTFNLTSCCLSHQKQIHTASKVILRHVPSYIQSVFLRCGLWAPHPCKPGHWCQQLPSHFVLFLILFVIIWLDSGTSVCSCIVDPPRDSLYSRAVW